MKVYPLTSPPPVPGLYVLFSPSSHKLYIGKAACLRRRYQAWKGVFSTGLGHRNLQLQAAAREYSDWDFRVLREMPTASPGELTVAEEQAIQTAFDRSPDLLLNGLIPVQGRAASTGVTGPKTVVMDGDRQVSYAHAAREIGVTTKQVGKRLAKKREKGTTTVTLDELREGTDRWRRYQKKPKTIPDKGLI